MNDSDSPQRNLLSDARAEISAMAKQRFEHPSTIPVLLGAVVGAVVGLVLPVVSVPVGILVGAGFTIYARLRLSQTSRALLTFAGGAILAVTLFIFVNKTEFLGQICYHFGGISLETKCINQVFIRFLWVISFALMAGGGWLHSRSKR